MRFIAPNLLCLAVLFCIGPLRTLHAQPITGVTLSGHVYDADTGAPMPGANVFVAGSMRGGATDAEGFFTIEAVPLGSHELVASFLGYETGSETVRLLRPGAQTFTFRLTPLVVESGQLEVTALSDKTWRRRFEKFEKFFLGVSRNASKCEILNPEVLDFIEDDERFVVTARAPLLIENKALGYQLRFVLDAFELRERQRYIKYGGRVGFTEMTPQNNKEKKRWASRRRLAYEGSLRHFLAALVRDRLWDEGFLLLSEEQSQQAAYAGVPGSRPSARVSGVKPVEVLLPGELPFERKFSFTGYLKVIYFREQPSAQYLKFRPYASGQLRSDEEEQTSYLALTGGPVTFTTDGHVEDAFGLTKFGYWYFERVADMLPHEYAPENLGPLPGLAAEAPTMDLAASLAEGVERVGEERYEEAVAALAPVLAETPGYRDDAHGMAAYWLGQAYVGLGRTAAAHQAWRLGLQALAERDTFVVRLADVYVRSIFATKDLDAYEPAAAAYLELLAYADDPLAEADRAVLERHVSQMLPLLEDDEREALLDGKPGTLYQRLRLQPEAGAALARWWRGQDPLPASPLNERVAEHLARVAYAEDNYAFQGSPEAYDERGRAYVRYGPPYSNVSVVVDISQATRGLRENGYPMPSTFIPPMNEFWTYRHVDELIYYLFALKGGRFQATTPEGLIPDDLMKAHKRTGIGHNNPATLSNPTGSRTPANQVLAEALFEVWKSVYEQLSIYHPSFEKQVEELAMQESDIQATSIGDSRTISASALSFVTGTEARFDALAREAAQQLEQEAPRAHSRVASAIEELPVAYRLARYLDDDGSTRTELFWSHQPGTLTLTKGQRKDHLRSGADLPEKYFMEMAVTLFSDDYLRRVPSGLRYLAADLPRGTPAPVQTIEVTGSTTPYHLAVQWDQFLAQGEGTEATAGTYLRTGVGQAHGLAPLSPDPSVLEMSDLKPVIVGFGGRPVVLREAHAPDASVPYPFTSLRADLPLGLEFEVYHLAFGDDDRTHYSVEYEVVRDPGRRREKRTSARTQYSGSSTTARDFIGVDLSPFAGGGPLDITVRIIDDVTGRTTERTIGFVLED